MKKRLLAVILLSFLLIMLPGPAFAQDYSFSIPSETVNAFWSEDGSLSLDYVIVFNNDANAHAIDFVDLGLPKASFVDSSITADVDGAKITDISRSGFQGTGPGVVSGVALGLGGHAIPAGGKGSVHANIGKISDMLYPDNQQGYASAEFAPAWFTSVRGATNLTVVYHLPQGIAQKDATWHASQPGWEGQPVVGTDDQGRVTFTWSKVGVVMKQKIDFGASFPSTLFPNGAPAATATSGYVSQPAANTSSNATSDAGVGFFIFILAAVILAMVVVVIRMSKNRDRTNYEPPSVTMEGYSVRHGLTAVEAAVLLDEPMDKILTMILFGVVKKGAAQVVSSDPLLIKVTEPTPTGLRSYENQLLNALRKLPDQEQMMHLLLEELMVDLFKDVNSKVLLFDREQTKNYYRSTVKEAWTQVEAAQTPEVTSQKFDDNLDWAMLDQDYSSRTQHVFENKQVSIPAWWPQFNPTFIHPADTATAIVENAAMSVPSSTPAVPPISLPVLPGSDFAASLVRGSQDLSAKLLGDMTAFTQKVKLKSIVRSEAQAPVAQTSSSVWDNMFQEKEQRRGPAQDSTSIFGGFRTGSSPHHTTSFHSSSSHHSSGGGGGHHCACACAGGGR